MVNSWIILGRVLAILSVLALLGAWCTQLLGHPVLGIAQQHFYNDAIVFALLGIFLLIDGFIHSRSTG